MKIKKASKNTPILYHFNFLIKFITQIKPKKNDDFF